MASLRRAAFTLFELLVVIAILGLLTGLALGGVQRVRAAALRAKCANNLRQIGLAVHSYHDAHQALPAGMNPVGGELPYLGWTARLLPYIEQPALWERTVADYRASSSLSDLPSHRNVTAVIPFYICPADSRGLGTNPDGQTAAFTHYLGSSGIGAGSGDGLLYYASKIRLAEVTDGTSHTLMVGERPPSSDSYFGWWYVGIGQEGNGSADFFLGVRERRSTFRTPTCPSGPYHFVPGSAGDPCDTFHFWSKHPGGAYFLYADGSTHFLHYSADSLLPALATRSGGEVVMDD